MIIIMMMITIVVVMIMMIMMIMIIMIIIIIVILMILMIHINNNNIIHAPTCDKKAGSLAGKASIHQGESLVKHYLSDICFLQKW